MTQNNIIKNLCIILLMVVVNQLKAQDYFNYQAIVSDANGAIVVSQSIGVRLSIIYDSSSGAVAYSEIHSATTDASGLINIAVGNGTSSDSYAAIDWSRSSVYLKSEIDLGSGYVDVGTDLIGKVPMALYAKTLEGLTITSGTISATGANLSGTVTASAFVGNGSGLTDITASVNSSTFKDANNNIVIGTELPSNTSNTSGIAIGVRALKSNTSGDQNSAVGYYALSSNTSGDANVAFGYAALQLNTTGNYNTSLGSHAQQYNTSGFQNTAIGYKAGNTNTSGSNNTLVGYNADVGSNNLTNATAIGANAVVTTSNTIRLGAAGIAFVKSDAQYDSSSDRRLKENIVKTPYGLEEVLKLNPVNYRFISNGLNQIGFIAQEVQPLLPEVVTGTEGDIEKGETLGITYSSLIPVLTKAIQEQQQQLEAQQKLIQSLLERLETLENK